MIPYNGTEPWRRRIWQYHKGDGGRRQWAAVSTQRNHPKTRRLF